jgi:hypothetical protein
MKKNRYAIHNTKYIILTLWKKRAGQSLAEVMVGLAIGAILIGAASFAITTTLKTNLSSQRSQFAASSAQEIIERVRGYASADWQNIYGLSKGSSTPYFFVASSSQFFVVQGSEGVVEGDIRSGLVGQWGFDEATGTVVYDGTGNKNNGDFVGDVVRATSTCKIANCLSFSTASTYISIPTSSLFHPTSSITVSAWVSMASSTGTFDAVVIPGSDDYYLQAQWPKWRFYVYNTLGIYKDVYSINDIITNQWTHLVGTYDGSNVVLYVNGAIQNSNSLTGDLRNSNGALTFSSSGRYFNGNIDDVRIYNRALSADEVKQLYNSTAYTRYFYVENGCRTNDASSTYSGVSPCGGGSVDDPSSQKVSSVVQWGTGVGTGQIILADILTRWKNAIFQQSDWSGGVSGNVLINSGTTFASSTNVNSGGGSLRINGL